MKCFRFNSSLSLIFLPVDENELRQNTFNVEDIESIVSKRHFKEVSWFVNCDNGRKVAISREKKTLSPTCDDDERTVTLSRQNGLNAKHVSRLLRKRRRHPRIWAQNYID